MDRVTLFDILNEWPSFTTFRNADPFMGDGPKQLSAGPTRALAMPSSRPKMRGMLVDIKENESGFEVKADIPGVTKEEIVIDTNDDTLTLEVQHTDSKESGGGDEAGDKMHYMERSSFFQKRSMRLPQSADLSKAEAKYENGVLTMRVPRRAEDAYKPKRIAVE